MSELVKTKFTVQGVEGVVLTGTKLVTCNSTPISLTIPKGVTVLGKSCLSGQDNLKRIRISSSVIKVEENCLSNCPNLEVILIHSSLREYEEILKYGNKARIEYVSDYKEDK